LRIKSYLEIRGT